MNLWMYTTAMLFGTSLAAPVWYLRARDARRALASREREFSEAQGDWLRRAAALDDAHHQLEARHREMLKRIAESGVIESIYQPVILTGPKAVGKTSLLSHWRTPWLQVQPTATSKHELADVPICDVTSGEKKPHFIDPDLAVASLTRLMLRVHDLPGEVSAQQAVRQLLQSETAHLRSRSRRDLGVVVVCMFDAGEVEHGLTEETRQYYNAEFFKQLARLVRQDAAEIERLILVFNKVDRLRQARSGAVPDSDLLTECEEIFLNTFEGLRELCHPGRIIPVLTMLDRENNRVQSRGAPLVMGEAARPLVESVAGERFANRVLTQQQRPVSAVYPAKIVPKKSKKTEGG